MISPIKTSVMVLIYCVMVQAAMAQSQPLEQPASVERSFFSVQLGVLSLFVNHELRLADQITLRTELGMQSRLYLLRSGHYSGFDISAIVEPRGYYNLTKRKEQGKDIADNSGNFVALRVHYARAIVLASGDSGVNVISIAPMWGIRRKLGGHFHYEAAAGIGWMRMIQPLKGVNGVLSTTYSRVRNLSFYLHFRIGYRF